VDLPLFVKSLALGVAVAAPVGPMSLLCVERTLARGQANGAVFGAGIAAADGTYAAIAAFGITALASALVAATGWIRLLGSLLLLFLGWRIMLRSPARYAPAAPGGKNSGAFALAYVLTMANPPTILFFIGIFASLSALDSAAHAALFTAGIFLGSMGWWLVLTTIVARTAAYLKPAALTWINRLSGAVLVAVAGYGVFRGYSGVLS
jgi:threonine/homoserine/homoserine lactone efflux protein